MAYLCTTLLCLLLAVGDLSNSALSGTAQLTVPESAALQQPPPTTPRRGEQHRKPPGKTGRRRLGGRRAGKRMAPGARPQEEFKPPTGPMRLELFSVHETRVRYAGEPPERRARAAVRLQLKLTGKRFGDLVGLGRLVVEKMVDDTGAVLASLDDFSPEERTQTSPIKVSKSLLARGYLGLTAEGKVPSRAAHKLTEVSGWIRVVYANKTEEVMVDNPLQFLGREVASPRLKELGLRIKVIKPGSEINERREGRGVGLQFLDGCRKQVRSVEFFDAWMKPLYARERPVKAADGQEYTFYGVVVGQVDEDSQMLLKVYPKIEEQQLRFHFENVELP